MDVIIRQARWDDGGWMAALICGFRSELRSLKGGDTSTGLDEARREFQEHEQRVAGVCLRR